MQGKSGLRAFFPRHARVARTFPCPSRVANTILQNNLLIFSRHSLMKISLTFH
jgi:hypothetical protein